MPTLPPEPSRLAQGSYVVYGLGNTGLQIGKYLSQLGAKVRFYDEAKDAAERHQARGFASLGALVGLEELFPKDVLVVSPGVPPQAAGRVRAKQLGIPVWGAFDLAASLLNSEIWVVTGSHGKSTLVTALAQLGAARGRRTKALGNLGTPVSAALLEADPPELSVLEASSFQLYDRRFLRAKGACFTSYAPNHLDWHPDEADYLAAKLGLVDQLEEGARVVAPRGFPKLEAKLAARPDLEVRWIGPDEAFGFDPDHPGQVRTPAGIVDLSARPETRSKAWLSPSLAFVAAAFDATPQELEALAESFSGLPHRLQDLGQVEGIHFVDDSKATTPAASAYSLARTPSPVVLILGGKDKGLSFADFKAEFSRAHRIVATGKAAGRVEADLGSLAPVRVDDFEAAFHRARELCPPGGTVLLAPGCSSFDAFSSFEERGRTFQALVQGLSPKEAR